MKLLNNRKIAWVVLIVCVFGSIFGFGGGSLAGRRREVLRVFNDGIDDSFAVRFSMDAYLENCAGYARTMAEEYRLHVNTEDDTASAVLELASMIGDGDDLDSRSGAYRALCSEIESLYTEFHVAEMSDEDRALFKNAYSNFQGEVSKIKFDDYHSLAGKFNRSLEGFPAGIVGKLLGIDLLDTF